MDLFFRWIVTLILGSWIFVAIFAGFDFWPEQLNNVRNPAYIATLIAIVLSVAKVKINSNFLNQQRAVNLVLVLSGFLFLKATLASYFSFHTNAYDFSVFNHMMPMTLEGRFMDSPVSPGNHFVKHLTYIIFLLTPIQLIFKSSVALIVLHGLFIALSLWIYERWLTQLQFSPLQKIQAIIAFVSFFLLGRFVISDFRIESFYPICGFFFIYSFFYGSRLMLFLATLLFLSVKEDAAVYATAFAVGVALSSKFFPKQFAQFLVGELSTKQQFKRAVVLAASSFFYFVINIKFVLPAFQQNDSAHLLGYMHKYGPSVWDYMWGILTHPQDLVVAFANSSFINIVIAFLGLCFLPLWAFLPIMAYFSAHFLSDMPVMKSLGFYYSAPVLPFLFLGGSVAISRISKVYSQKGKWLLPTHMILCLAVGGGYLKFRTSPVSYTHFLEIAKSVPNNQPLCVQSSLMPHFGVQPGLRLLTKECEVDNVPFVLLHPGLDAFPHSQESFESIRQQLKQSAKYELVAKNGFELFKLK